MAKETRTPGARARQPQQAQEMGMQAMEEGHVLSCTVDECTYNQSRECHAPAIVVGSEHATCDTFTKGEARAMTEATPPVSKCSIDACKFNQNLMCHAPGITVDYHSAHADCLTYVPISPSA